MTASVATGPRPILFFDRGCPFSWRVLATASHLGVALDARSCRLGDKPEGIERHSPSRRVPLFVHGEVVLAESRVMIEYLAELHGLAGALPDSIAGRARHRHAMAVVDGEIAPFLFARQLGPRGGARLEEALDVVEDVAGRDLAPPSLFTLHAAPILLAFRAYRPDSPVTRAILARPRLRGWLDGSAELPCIAGTAPDLETFHEDLAHARAAGIL